MKAYNYEDLIKDAEFEVKYYEEQYNKAEGRLFRARLALEALLDRERKQYESTLAKS